jgi:Fe-S cluster assembly iron-binding protein IscA
MVIVTEKARHELKKLLRAKVDWPGARLRLIDRGQGVIGLGVDLVSPDDEVIECDGEAVMVIGPEFSSGLNMITLDVDTANNTSELVISEKKNQQPVPA